MPEHRDSEIHDWYSLAQALREARYGLTIEEIMRTSGASRSTANRWLERAEERLIKDYQLEKTTRNGRVHYRLVPDRALQRRQFESDPLFRLRNSNLIDLAVAIDLLRSWNMGPKADRLEDLKQVLESMMRRDDAALYRAALQKVSRGVAVALPPATPLELDDRVAQTINDAYLREEAVRVTYRGNNVYDVHPLGYVYGPGTHYLIVAGVPSGSIFRLRLDRITNAMPLGKLDGRPESFDIHEHVDSAFAGLFDGDQFDVVLRFSGEAVEEAKHHRFHPNQDIEEDGNGGLIVKFSASGDLAICHHVFTWGSSVEILQPASLRDRYADLLRRALEPYGTGEEL